MRVQLATATLKSEGEDTTGSVRALKKCFYSCCSKMQTENELISDL